MKYVLDASALIAYLRAEPGGEVVREILLAYPEGCYAHALNVCEVYYDAFRRGGGPAAHSALEDLFRARLIFREDLSLGFVQAIGTLKAVQRRVSLADCCAAVLARNLNARLITADHHEFDALAGTEGFQVEFIR